MVTVSELDTPFLTVDLDAVERNIVAMQDYCDAHGIAFAGARQDAEAAADRTDAIARRRRGSDVPETGRGGGHGRRRLRRRHPDHVSARRRR